MKKSKGKILPPLVNILLIFIFAFPIFWMFSASFQTLVEIMQSPPTLIPKHPQLSNYSQAWASSDFTRYTINSIIVTLGSIGLQLLTVIPAAYAYARMKFRGKKVFWAMTLVCLMVPMQLMFLPNYINFAKVGILNTNLSLILPFASSAFGIFMLRQTFVSVPEEIIEAARLDNASESVIIRKIFMPMARPTIVTLVLFTFISRWNDYFWPMVMTTIDSARTLPVGVAMLKMTDQGVPWNIVMAANVIMVLPILLAYIFAQDKIIKAFTYTGIK